MLERALNRAIENIAGIIRSRYKSGKTVGEVIGSFAIVAPAAHYMKKNYLNGKAKEVQLNKKRKFTLMKIKA